MKKTVILTLDREKDIALRTLRNTGVVHLEKNFQEPVSQDITRLELERNHVQYALSILPEDIERRAITSDLDEARELLLDILDEDKQRKELQERLIQIEADLKFLSSWDDINPEDIKELSEKGVYIGLYQVPEKGFDLGPFKDKVHHVGGTKGFLHLMVVAQSPEELPLWDAVEMPEKGVDALVKEKQELQRTLFDLDENLKLYAEKEPLLLWYQGHLLQDLDYEIARLKFAEEEKLAYITGFVPVDELEELKKTASEQKWGLVLSDPELDDEVPTKLKVSKFSGLLMPVMEFLGILPGYRELDISLFFLIFFTIFTSMLIGDAGYGLIFLACSLLGMGISAARKKSIGKGLVLLLILSLGTIAWGMVTGTWFASKALMEIPLLQQLKLPYFTGSEEEMIVIIMGVSFLLGVVQLCLGIVQGFLFEFPQLKSFARIGWLAVMIAIYSLILTLVIDRQGVDAYPKEMLWLLLGGVIFIFVFGAQEPGQNFFKGIAMSFANFLQNFLDIVGTFSNLMSYVRLFAVGLASVKIAETFNVLARDMADGWTIVFAVLIILLGHTLNIILGLMAILVHAVRLNILEYSGQIGIEWSGFKYEPFRVRNLNE